MDFSEIRSQIQKISEDKNVQLCCLNTMFYGDDPHITLWERFQADFEYFDKEIIDILWGPNGDSGLKKFEPQTRIIDCLLKYVHANIADTISK